MQRTTASLFALLVGIAALGLAPAPAKALVIYSYTGNNFDVITDSNPPAGSYTTSMSVSGSFTVAAPLVLPTVTGFAASVLSYSFSDGRGILDNSNSIILQADMSTDPTGLPIAWRVLVSQFFVGGATAIGDQVHGILASNLITFDVGQIIECILVSAAGDCLSPPLDQGATEGGGVWAVTTGVVPEPSTLLLFGVGLAGLAGFGWRRRQV